MHLIITVCLGVLAYAAIGYLLLVAYMWRYKRTGILGIQPRSVIWRILDYHFNLGLCRWMTHNTRWERRIAADPKYGSLCYTSLAIWWFTHLIPLVTLASIIIYLFFFIFMLCCAIGNAFEYMTIKVLGNRANPINQWWYHLGLWIKTSSAVHALRTHTDRTAQGCIAVLKYLWQWRQFILVGIVLALALVNILYAHLSPGTSFGIAAFVLFLLAGPAKFICAVAFTNKVTLERRHLTNFIVSAGVVCFGWVLSQLGQPTTPIDIQVLNPTIQGLSFLAISLIWLSLADKTFGAIGQWHYHNYYLIRSHTRDHPLLGEDLPTDALRQAWYQQEGNPNGKKFTKNQRKQRLDTHPPLTLTDFSLAWYRFRLQLCASLLFTVVMLIQVQTLGWTILWVMVITITTLGLWVEMHTRWYQLNDPASRDNLIERFKQEALKDLEKELRPSAVTPHRWPSAQPKTPRPYKRNRLYELLDGIGSWATDTLDGVCPKVTVTIIRPDPPAPST